MDPPAAYIRQLVSYTTHVGPTDDPQMERVWLKCAANLKSALATQPNAFVTQFIDEQGLAALLAFLNRYRQFIAWAGRTAGIPKQVQAVHGRGWPHCWHS